MAQRKRTWLITRGSKDRNLFLLFPTRDSSDGRAFGCSPKGHWFNSGSRDFIISNL